VHGVLDWHWMFVVHWSRMDQMGHVMGRMGVHSRMSMVGHDRSCVVANRVAVVAMDLVVLLVHGVVSAVV
jgi:uncharacterized alpha/beta hydrolase family protein